ncbi:MAG: hypothetical protein KDE58_02980, partial [Caldilineaceae bacterium]|nr:hypothetical protein [Caldilineaceae bacterium]
LDEMLQDRLRKSQDEINSKSDDYLLNVNEIEFVNFLVANYSIANLELRFDDIFISTYEKSIPAERFPPLFDVTRGRSYTKDVIKFHVPFSGDVDLLYCRPNHHIRWSVEVSNEDSCLCFEVINFHDAPETIKQQSDDVLRSIRQQYGYVVSEVNSYNNSLLGQIQSHFQYRKQHLLKKHDLLGALGVPIRKRTDYPGTFAIPNPQTRKKIQISQPNVTEKGYSPEPTLDLSVYQDILQVIHDIGKQFERMPSTYSQKGEEDLRDHILLVLEPRFEGSATGETFNKIGKTDILLRYNNSNVFIAECKFWKGSKLYLETITQLLGYLTWRDSKAAVVLFVENKDFSSVLKTVEADTPNHQNYLGFASRREETWFNYRFHINDDKNREVKVAILLFHIPPP